MADRGGSTHPPKGTVGSNKRMTVSTHPADGYKKNLGPTRAGSSTHPAMGQTGKRNSSNGTNNFGPA